MIRNEATAALPLACLIAVGALSACSASPPKSSEQASDGAAMDVAAELEEEKADVAATKQHIALLADANAAGPAIHVDPMPRAGAHRHHRMTAPASSKTNA